MQRNNGRLFQLSIITATIAAVVTLAGCGGGSSAASMSPGGGSGSPSPSPSPMPLSCGTAGGIRYVQAFKSATAQWCVDPGVWSSRQTDIQKFFPYGDAVVTNLESLFAFTPPGLPFTFEVKAPFGGAYTGSDFGIGDTVTADAFWNNFPDPVSGQNIPGFYGYLFSLHEAINVWTGQISPGWPVDWWADHRSPFPNSMDYHILQVIGTARNDSTILAAATAQHERFGDPSVSSYDSEVAMFDGLYNQYGGFSAFVNAFKFIQGDGLQWGSISIDPSKLLTEYVIAYLQLGIGTSTDLTQSVFAADGVGTKDPAIQYTIDSNAVRSIGSAHCSIRSAAAAGQDVSAALAALRSGNYQSATAGGATQATCPIECLWIISTNQCAARW